MAATLRMLHDVEGDRNPPSATYTTLYTVPLLNSAIISSVVVANRHATLTRQFRMSLVKSGETASPPGAHTFVYYDVDVEAKNSFMANPGWTLAAGDKIVIYASVNDLGFYLGGQENS